MGSVGRGVAGREALLARLFHPALVLGSGGGSEPAREQRLAAGGEVQRLLAHVLEQRGELGVAPPFRIGGVALGCGRLLERVVQRAHQVIERVRGGCLNVSHGGSSSSARNVGNGRHGGTPLPRVQARVRRGRNLPSRSSATRSV